MTVAYEFLTDRLSLRRPDPEADLDEVHAIFADPALWTHAPDGRHHAPALTHAWLVRAAVRWDSDGLSYWVARLREDGTLIGSGGVQRQSTGAWNLFYRISVAAQGRGLATEIARAGLEHAHALDPTVPRVAWIRPINTASRRLAERVGLVSYGLRIDPSDLTPRLAYADRPLADAYGEPAAEVASSAAPAPEIASSAAPASEVDTGRDGADAVSD